jgi:hypothetical protein
MNLEKLNKINKLTAEYYKVKNFLDYGFSCEEVTLFHNLKILRPFEKYFALFFKHDRSVNRITLYKEDLMPCLIAYCDKLKAELKELGYEV